MTAIAERRKRRTVTAAVLAVVLSMVAAVMLVIGTITLSNSREGEAVGIDERPHETFPTTPNAVLAVTDDDGALASVVVLTLLPEGQGGSIVTIPVNADSTAGFGLQRRPLDEMFDADDPDSLVAPLEEMLSITIQRALIVDPEGFAELIAPIESVQVMLPHDVVDSVVEPDVDDAAVDDAVIDDPAVDDSAVDVLGEAVVDEGLLVASGPQTLGPEEIAEVLTAIDDGVAAYDQHDIDVAVWDALARSAPITTPPEPVPVDTSGRPAAPADGEELFDLLWQGDVGVRDIALITLPAGENPTEVDVVLLDRRDSNLVFAQISPGLVSTPNSGLKIRVVASYTEEQLAESDGLFVSSADVVLGFIGQMLAVDNSVVSADSAATGAPEVTLVEVSSEQFLEDTERAAEALFGEAEVRLADRVLDGVDIQVTLGMTYITRELIIRELARQNGDADAEGSEESVPGSATDSSTPATLGTGTVGGDG